MLHLPFPQTFRVSAKVAPTFNISHYTATAAAQGTTFRHARALNVRTIERMGVPTGRLSLDGMQFAVAAFLGRERGCG